jgi:hypothetical protein
MNKFKNDDKNTDYYQVRYSTEYGNDGKEVLLSACNIKD